MGPNYGDPFRLWRVVDPETGKARQLSDEAEARRLAAEISSRVGAPLGAVLRPSKTLYVLAYSGGAVDRGQRVNTRCKTAFEAKQWVRGRIREGKGAPRGGRMLLAEAAKAWIEDVRLRQRRESTLRDYEAIVGLWKAHFGEEKRLRDVTQDDIAEFFKKRSTIGEDPETQRQAKPRTLIKHLRVLRAFFAHCRRRRLIDEDPTAAQQGWKPTRLEPKTLEAAEIRALIRAAPRAESITVKREESDERAGFQISQEVAPNPRLAALIIAGVTTAQRYGALTQLRWQDVSLEKDEIHFRAETMKAGAELRLPLAASLKRALSPFRLGARAEDLIFAAKECRKSFKRALRRAKVAHPGISFHALRRSAATLLARQGIPLEVIRRVGGWSVGNDVLVKHYRAISFDEIKVAVAALDDVVTGGKTAGKAAARAARGAS